MIPLAVYTFSLGVFFLGIAVGTKIPRRRLPWFALLLVPIGIQALCTQRPDWGWTLFRHSGIYFQLEGWMGMPPAFFFIGACVRHLRTWLVRDALLVAIGCIFVYLGFHAHGQSFFGTEGLNGTVDADGMCLQSTGCTCAPASAAMLLHRYGIVSTEKDMARRCHTSLRGTSLFCMAYGIQTLLEESNHSETVWIGSLNFEELKRLNRPCIITTRCSTLADHVMLVLNITPEHVEVADPLVGVREISHPDFIRIYKNEGLYVD